MNSTNVNISPVGQELINLCEKKVELMNKAEQLTDDTRIHLLHLKNISNEQYTLLQLIRDIDSKIEYLQHRI